jgi:hypothetical protein
MRRGASLFHVSTMLQKNGFKVPESSELDKFKAKVDYQEYCNKYNEADLTPDYLDDEALDIYVFLLELFKDTRYELRPISMLGFFFVVFPYSFFRHLAILLYYFFVGLFYCSCLILFPLVLICVGLGITYEFYKMLEF